MFYCDFVSAKVKSHSFHHRFPWLLAGLHSGEIILYDYTSSKVVACFNEHVGPVRSVHFHATLPFFVSGSDDCDVFVWDYVKRKLVMRLKGHTDYVRSVEFHPTLPWILSSSDDGTCRIWNWQSQQTIAAVAGHSHYIMCARFHPTLDLFASCSLDGTIRLWSYSKLESKKNCSLDYLINEEDNDSWTSITSLNDLNSRSSKNSFLPLQKQNRSFNRLVSNDSSESFLVSEVDCTHICNAHDRGVNSIAFNSTGTLLASCSDDRTVKLWKVNYDDLDYINEMKKHTNNVNYVSFHSFYDIILSCSEDGTVQLWCYSSDNCVQIFENRDHCFWTVSFLDQSDIFAIGYDSGTCVRTLMRTYKLSSNIFNESSMFEISANFTDNSLCIREMSKFNEVARITLEDKNLRSFDSRLFFVLGNCYNNQKLQFLTLFAGNKFNRSNSVKSNNFQSLFNKKCFLTKVDLTLYSVDLSLNDLERITNDYYNTPRIIDAEASIVYTEKCLFAFYVNRTKICVITSPTSYNFVNALATGEIILSDPKDFPIPDNIKTIKHVQGSVVYIEYDHNAAFFDVLSDELVATNKLTNDDLTFDVSNNFDLVNACAENNCLRKCIAITKVSNTKIVDQNFNMLTKIKATIWSLYWLTPDLILYTSNGGLIIYSLATNSSFLACSLPSAVIQFSIKKVVFQKNYNINVIIGTNNGQFYSKQITLTPVIVKLLSHYNYELYAINLAKRTNMVGESWGASMLENPDMALYARECVQDLYTQVQLALKAHDFEAAEEGIAKLSENQINKKQVLELHEEYFNIAINSGKLDVASKYLKKTKDFAALQLFLSSTGSIQNLHKLVSDFSLKNDHDELINASIISGNVEAYIELLIQRRQYLFAFAAFIRYGIEKKNLSERSAKIIDQIKPEIKKHVHDHINNINNKPNANKLLCAPLTTSLLICTTNVDSTDKIKLLKHESNSKDVDSLIKELNLLPNYDINSASTASEAVDYDLSDVHTSSAKAVAVDKHTSTAAKKLDGYAEQAAIEPDKTVQQQKDITSAWDIASDDDNLNQFDNCLDVVRSYGCIKIYSNASYIELIAAGAYELALSVLKNSFIFHPSSKELMRDMLAAIHLAAFCSLPLHDKLQKSFTVARPRNTNFGKLYKLFTYETMLRNERLMLENFSQKNLQGVTVVCQDQLQQSIFVEISKNQIPQFSEMLTRSRVYWFVAKTCILVDQIKTLQNDDPSKNDLSNKALECLLYSLAQKALLEVHFVLVLKMAVKIAFETKNFVTAAQIIQYAKQEYPQNETINNYQSNYLVKALSLGKNQTNSDIDLISLVSTNKVADYRQFNIINSNESVSCQLCRATYDQSILASCCDLCKLITIGEKGLGFLNVLQEEQ